MTLEQSFGQLLWLWVGWRVMESRFELESSTLFLKVEETHELWPERNRPVLLLSTQKFQPSKIQKKLKF